MPSGGAYSCCKPPETDEPQLFPSCHSRLNLRGKGVGTSSLTVTEGRRGPAHTSEIWGPSDFLLVNVDFFWW